MDERLASITRVLLVAIWIAMTQGLSLAQQSSGQPGTLSRSWVAVHVDNQAPSVEHGQLDQVGTTLCSSQVPDITSQSPLKAKHATMTNDSLAYTPLSARCKFRLFLKQTYSPYTFASAGFQATWAQA